MGWVSPRNGLPNHYLDLRAPPEPAAGADWLTREEFARLLDGAWVRSVTGPGLWSAIGWCCSRS